MGGLLQVWLVRRFTSIVALHPLFMGLIFLSQRLWVLGGVLTGTGAFIVIAAELYASFRTQVPGRKSLTSDTRQSLSMFDHTSRRLVDREESNDSTSEHEERGSLASRERLSRARSRGSLASVFEMMSITLATIPSHTRKRLPVPLGERFCVGQTAARLNAGRNRGSRRSSSY